MYNSKIMLSEENLYYIHDEEDSYERPIRNMPHF